MHEVRMIIFRGLSKFVISDGQFTPLYSGKLDVALLSILLLKLL